MTEHNSERRPGPTLHELETLRKAAQREGRPTDVAEYETLIRLYRTSVRSQPRTDVVLLAIALVAGISVLAWAVWVGFR